MPRVLIATRLFRPEPAAAAQLLGALADALCDAGAEVEVLTSEYPARHLAPEYRSESPETSAASSRRDLVVHRWPVLRDATGAVRGYVQYLSYDIPLFFRLLAARRPDIVVVQPPPTTNLSVRLACAICRIPYVCNADDIVSDAAEAQGTSSVIVRIVRAVEAWTWRGAAGIIGVTPGVVDRIRELSGKEAHLVPNGIDTDRELVVERPEGFPSGTVFLYAGTVAEWLRPEVFLEAFPMVKERIPDAVLVYLGQGTAWEALERRARGMDGVLLRPVVSAEEAHQWYANASVSLASLGRDGYEYAYPTKILSSLAAGTPVVYAGPGQARDDIHEGGLGAAVDVDPEQVAEAMVAVAQDRSESSQARRTRLHRWVEEHRSVRVSSRRAAAFVLECAGLSDR